VRMVITSDVLDIHARRQRDSSNCVDPTEAMKGPNNPRFVPDAFG